MKKNKNVEKVQESTKYIESIVPAAEVVLKKPKEDAVEIESMAEMTPSDRHHWSHLQAKTDLTAEKILNESIISGNFDNAVATEMATEKSNEEDESNKLGPSISGAIEAFMSKNKNKDLSDK
jgi:hypothetical protein